MTESKLTSMKGLQQAAHTVIETVTQMASEGRPLMQRVLPDGDVHWWAHYPDDDARDAFTRSRWFYHIHAPGDRDPSEHGHFHLFLHRTQLQDASEPLGVPAEGEEAAAFVVHVAGLAINHQGLPTSWFATNRWVTDEFMYPASTVIDHLPLYNVDATEEDTTVNRFLTAMVALYRDEIAAMLLARDEALRLLVDELGPSAYETANDILASCPIDLDSKIESLGIE